MIVDYQAPIARTRDNKRMLEVSKTPEGKWHAKINFSSLDVISSCMRKAHYQLGRKLKSDVEAPATLFGKAIHKALEHWYTLAFSQRILSTADAKQAELLAYGHGATEQYDGALESIRRFVLCAQQLRSLGDSDKRSIANGVHILKAYFSQYANDKLAVVSDKDGMPLIERDFEFRLCESNDCTVDYFGTIDAILQHQDTGEIMCVDHKTTHALGKEFIARAKPNHQFTGYIEGARRAFGIDTRLFMINGIQVAKTKCEFMRIVTERDESDYLELQIAVVNAVGLYLFCLKMDAWPMSAPTACTMWGGCQYLDACSIPIAMRENVISAKWGQT